MPLSGKVALVTGGSRGIGAATARRLAGDGADVAITYERNAGAAEAVAADVRAAGRRAVAIQADSVDAGAVRAAVDAAAAELGRLDVLVNNAGIFMFGPLEDVTVEELDRTMAIHARAAFVAAQAAARHMSDGGRIVSIGTSLATVNGGPGTTLYSMSKAALIGLTKGLARDLGPRGVTAAVVHPGPIDTDMNPADAEEAREQVATIPVGHFGRAEDVAATVAHLAGEGGRFINGAEIAVDGGQTA